LSFIGKNQKVKCKIENLYIFNINFQIDVQYVKALFCDRGYGEGGR
jgi:hypothetical protein